jgi:hypothetical protein
MMTLEDRLGLLWVRKHDPATWPRLNDPDAPAHKTITRLVAGGLICFSPQRRRFEPVTYSLTGEGRRALEP